VVPPTTTNHERVAAEVATPPARTTVRIRRAREMRARNSPTNGAHESHQAQ